MSKFLKYSLSLFTLLAFISCNNDTKKSTFFGGKIKNPKSDHVILFNNDSAIDTIFLNEKNIFSAKYDSLPEGLYHFKHGPEHQFVYIEPNDSILIRLNTWDFDESLVFSGIGAEKNNALIGVYLDIEKEKKDFYPHYKLKPSEFKQKADQLLTDKKEQFEDFLKENPDTSKDFLELFKITLNYPIYARLEYYPEIYKNKQKLDKLPELPDNFFEHRKNASLELGEYINYYAYRYYFYNRIYADVNVEEDNGNCDNYIVTVLNSIDKNVTKEETKNIVLKKGLIHHLYSESTCAVNKKAFYRFFELSTDIKDKKQIQRLLNDSKKLEVGSNLTDFNVYNYSNAEVNINDLIKNKKSVIYFWNDEFITEDFLSSRIKHLIEKHPNLNFIGVKFGSNNTTHNKGYDIKSQYYITDKSKANTFLSSKLPRTILVDTKGNIINGFASLSSKKIFNQLEDLEKN